MDPLVIVFGLGVGILVGLTGIGGGSLMTPLLILFFGIKPVVAIGTDLAYGAVTKTRRRLAPPAQRHGRPRRVEVAGVRQRAGRGRAACSLLERARHSTSTVAAVARRRRAADRRRSSMLARALFVPARRARARRRSRSTPRTKVAAVAHRRRRSASCSASPRSARGALIGLALILVFRLTPHRVVGTDVFHAAILLWAAGLAHLVGGNVDFALMGTILLGSLPGVLDRHGARRPRPGGVLRPALGCVLLGSALGVLTKAGARPPGVGDRRRAGRRSAPPPWLVASARRFRTRRRPEACAHALRADPPARSSRPRRSTSCARSPPSSSAGAAVQRRQGLDRAAAPGREGVPPGAASRSR